MAAKSIVGEPRSLSYSNPDVSSDHHHHQHQPPLPSSSSSSSRPISPLPDTPFISSPSEVANTNYNIDDDAWADKTDPVTGSVFYIEPSVPSRSSVVPSSSSSSLSSSPSISEYVAPPSPTVTQYSCNSLPERFSNSVHLMPESSISPEERFGSSQSPSPYNSGSFQWEKPVSMRKKLKKMVGIRGAAKKPRKKEHLYSGSLSDLNQLHSEYPMESSPTHLLQIPQASQYGSRGTSLISINPYQTTIEMDLSQFKLGTEAGTQCSLERLGIIPARSLSKGKFGSLVSLQLSIKTHYPPPVNIPKPVVVRDLVRGYPAATTQIKSGDTILSVNGHPVSMDNVEAILASISSKLSLLIKKGHSSFSTSSSYNHTYFQDHSYSSSLLSPPQTPSDSSGGGLVRLVTGGKGPPRSNFKKHHEHQHMLLYVTLDTKEEDPPEKDILFRYPQMMNEEGGGGGGVKTLDKLVKLRGVFLTLSDTLANVTGSMAVCNSSILLDGKLFHLSTAQEGKEMILLAFPSELVTQYQLQLLLESVNRIMRMMFKSVQNAFTNGSHCSTIEHLLGLIFDSVLSEPSPSPSSPLLGVPAIPRLKFPTSRAIKLDAILSDLESANHANRPEMLHMRRPFLLTGSCLMHKGALACSHLSQSDLREVTLFCHAYRLLELTASESVSQIVIWKEVFLGSLSSKQSDPVYSLRCQQRMFLLVIGLEQMLLCMLMQQQPLHHSRMNHPPNVDAVYVDRGRALLLELRAQDLLNRDLEHFSSIPCLLSADTALSSLFTRSSRPPVATSSQRDHVSPKKSRKATDPIFGVRFNSARRLSIEGSESDDEVGGSSEKPFRTQSMVHVKPSFRQRKIHHSHSLTGAFSDSKKVVKALRPAYTLTSGLDNLLLHYVNLEPAQGLMLCPTHQTGQATPIQSELLQCFQQTSSVIRRLLRGGGVEGEECVESDSDSSDSDNWDSEEEETKEGVSKPCPFAPQASSVVEHGVLLECSTQSLKTSASIHYWIIGRYFPEVNRELYICCQENISQSTIEMAFKLLFGWPG